MKKLLHILLFLLFAANIAAQKYYVIDSVCVDAQRYYSAYGELGSTYKWSVVNESGDTIMQSSGADIKDLITPGLYNYGSEMQITWTTPGFYKITDVQYSIHGCDTLQQGYVRVFNPPTAFAGNPQSVCSSTTVYLDEADAQYYSSVEWISFGDGKFNNKYLLNPEYIAGPNDKLNGYAVLGLRAYGLAINETCHPANNTIEIRFTNPEITFHPIHLRCFNDNSGSVKAVVSNGNKPFKYKWTGPNGFTSASDSIFNLAAGEYIVTITDNLGCQSTNSVQITQPDELLVQTDLIKNVTCFGGNDGSARVLVTGGTADYNYEWNTFPVQNAAQAANLTAGDYKVTITDLNGCTTFANVKIAEPAPLALSADSTDAKCLGFVKGSIDLTVTGGTPFKKAPHYLYNWTNKAGFTASTEDLFNIPGELLYNVVVTDSVGCMDTLSIFVNEEKDIQLAVEKVDSILCFGNSNGAIDITPGSGLQPYEFIWNTGQTSEDLSGITAGKYHVKVTDANGCSSELDFELYEPEELLASIVSSDFKMCEPETILLEAESSGGTGSHTYLWSGTGASFLSATNILNPEFKGSPAGVYSLVFSVTDENNCNTAETISLEVFPVTYNTVFDTICPSDLPLTWNGQVYDAAGTYENIIANVFGCDSVITFNLFVNDKIELTATTQNAGPANQPVGSINLSVSGGNPDYTFNWSNGEITEDISGLSSGDYTVIVTDANGCAEVLTVKVISEPVNMSMNCPAQKTIVCKGDADNSIYTFYAEFAAAGGNAYSECGIDTATFAWGGDEIVKGSFCLNINRTYIVKDSCGTPVACVQPVIVNDKEPPVMTCPPEIVLASSTKPAHYTTYSAWFNAGGFADDNCEIVESSFKFVKEISDGLTDPETITRTYQISDFCGNTATCEQIIKIFDDSGIYINCPPTVTVSCSGDQPAPYLTFADFVKGGGSAGSLPGIALVESSFKWEGDVSDNKSCPETITRTYSINNENGEVTTCEQLIIIRDAEKPVLVFGNKIISCPEDKPIIYRTRTQFEAGKGNSAGDNCGLDWSTFKFLRESDDKESCPQTIVRWYEIFDLCGNRKESMEIIRIHDNLPPVIYHEPKNIVSDCYIPKPYKNREEFELLGGGAVIENCNNYTVKFVSDSEPEGLCPSVIKRTYLIADMCDNQKEYVQTIIIKDTIAPTISCPDEVVFDAGIEDLKNLTGLAFSEAEQQIQPANFAVLGITANDNCLFEVTYTDIKTGICPVVISRTFVVTDACGNKDECQQEIKLLQLSTPGFGQFGPYCLNAAPDLLPEISKEGIKGTWNPATIDTKTKGMNTYKFTPDADQCAVEVEIEVEITDEIEPVFAAIGPFCLNSTAATLSPVSENGITGTWNPATITTGTKGKTTYTFTPDPGQCAISVSIDIEITDEIIPLFVNTGPFCLNSAAATLSPVSDNGITGTWNPAIIETGVLGQFSHTFTPDAGQCAVPVTIEIKITDEIEPLFAIPAQFCLNRVSTPLPQVSDNNISGAWNPAKVETDKTGTFTYTFTPDAGQCAVPVSIDIEIKDEIEPVFARFGPFCLNSVPTGLSTVSENGVTGIWNPAKIETDIVGRYSYVFTPDAGQCALPLTIEIEVSDEITPEFASLNQQCPNTGVVELPLISENGIKGIWSPAFIDTKDEGIFSFIFTPDPGQCAVEVNLNIEVSDKIPPDAVCKNITVYLDTDGKASVSAADIDNGSSDNCGLDTLFLSRYDFDCADLGENSVTLTAVDKVGLTGFCDAVVTVLDTVSPVVMCRGPFEIQLDENAEYTLTVVEVLESAHDNCGDIDTMYVYPHQLDCDHIGLTTISLWVVDTHGNRSYCETQVTIYGNKAPTVLDDSISTFENVPVVIEAIENDFDEKTSIDISTMSISINPLHGNVTINTENGDLIYTPDHNFSGIDVLQYRICDDGIPCDPECGTANVFIYVEAMNDTATAGDDYYSIGCESITGNVLENDQDDNGTENLIVNTIPLYPPIHGEVNIDADGTFVYYPNDGFIGIDSFQYVVCDNGIPSLCDTATVYFEIDCNEENPDPVQCELFVPEGFSPNEDGIHDFFRIMCIEHYPNAKLMIFNLNGNLLWEKEHYGNYDVWGDQYNAWWWGTSVLSKYGTSKQMINGEPKLKIGNYVYVLQLGNGMVRKGTVMVAY
ncbi:MAG: gliding motility-associated C-terminal domain-containing protein [Bacteroidales bacterium]|nr:gliding motility-associated C-terminal domain-containing protein [Bacteroidales bacterium]